MATGILHPKLSDKFVVRFSAAFDATDDVSLEDANTHLTNLSLQTTAARIPPEIFGKGAPNKSNMSIKEFRDFVIDEPIVVCFEDDITNLVQKGVDFLSRGDVTAINILVAKLDGAEGVVEAFYFGSCRLKSLTHSELKYGGTGGGFRGTIVNDTSGDKGQISGSYGLDELPICKELSVTAIYTKRAIFNGSMSIRELAKQTLGV